MVIVVISGNWMEGGKMELTKGDTNLLIKHFCLEFCEAMALHGAKSDVLRGKDPEKVFRAVTRPRRWKLYWKIQEKDGNAILKKLLREAMKLRYKLERPVTTRKALLKWWLEVYVRDTELPGDLYSERSTQIYQMFKFIRHGRGHHRETKQYGFQLSANKNAPLRDHMKEVNLLLPLIKENNGYKHIGISEYTDGAGGSYFMEARGKKAVLAKLVYSRRIVIIEGTVEECVDFVRLNHPYEGGEGECDDREDDY